MSKEPEPIHISNRPRDIREWLGETNLPPSRSRRLDYGRWLDEGMDRSVWLGMGRLVGSLTLVVALVTALVYFGLALLGVDVGL